MKETSALASLRLTVKFKYSFPERGHRTKHFKEIWKALCYHLCPKFTDINKMTPRFWLSVAFLIDRICLSESTAQCRPADYSISGMFLKRHTFKTVQANFAAECEMICEQEARCQSYNVIIGQNICELNSRTKEARPEHFMPDMLRFYKRRTFDRVPLGSIPELPAETCSEIKQSEGNKMADAKYWIYADRNTNETIQATCVGDWHKVNKGAVCFEAKNNIYGLFYMTKTGSVKAMKLVHRNGSIHCNANYRATYWGCSNTQFYPKNSLMTIITNASREALLPPAEELQQNFRACNINSRHIYSLDNTSQNSPELVFGNLSSPLSLLRNQELQIWYGQDWIDCSEFDNSGRTCVDVYAWYI